MTLALDFAYIVEVFPRIARTVPLTLYILSLSLLFSLLFGVLLAIVRIRRTPLLYPLSSLCLSFFRSVPSILNLMLVYYGFPLLMESFGITIQWEKATFCIVALVLIYGCYISEYLRPAWLSVSQEMHDAAAAVGMSQWQKTRRIILPLAFPVSLPSLGNAAIDMLKDTSILFVIGMPDIMGRIHSIISTDYGVKKLEVYIAGAVIYAGLVISGIWLVHLLERRISKFKASRAAGAKHAV